MDERSISNEQLCLPYAFGTCCLSFICQINVIFNVELFWEAQNMMICRRFDRRRLLARSLPLGV